MVRKVSFIIFALLCIAIGFYPLTYALVKESFGLLSSKDPFLLNSTIWNAAFYTHISMGGLALLIGWLQFVKRIRIKHVGIHKTIGKCYVIAVLASGLASLYIAYFATGGIIPSLGFTLLGLIWLYSTIMAYLSIKRGHIQQHQMYMIFSYAACFAAVTLRIWLPLLSSAFGEFLLAYKIVAWLCWIPNVWVAYIINRKLKLLP
jgi:uncharacterized membrane protein